MAVHKFSYFKVNDEVGRGSYILHMTKNYFSAKNIHKGWIGEKGRAAGEYYNGNGRGAKPDISMSNLRKYIKENGYEL